MLLDYITSHNSKDALATDWEFDAREASCQGTTTVRRNAWLGNFHKDQEESIVHMCRTTLRPIDTASSTRISQDAHPPYYLRQSTSTSMILTSHQITDQEQPHRDLTDTMKLNSCHCRTWLVGCHTMPICCLSWVYCSKIDIVNRFNSHNGGSTVTVCSLFVSFKRRSDKWQKLYWV